MASMDDLLVSWNFDKISEPDIYGQIEVLDVSNNYTGTGISFTPNTNDFILKEEIKTNRKILHDSIEGYETIQTLEDDDLKANLNYKPSSVQLMIENSMFQIISDEMLNMFSTIDAYTFKFAEPSNKYKFDYDKLSKARYDFFSKIIEKPNLEKYIEFYKWIDSSLGYMIEQLKPESANNIKGLKNTVESHILEKNKYKHQLPLTVQANKIFSSNVNVINTKTLLKSDVSNSLTSSIDDILQLNKLYTINNYNSVQTSGKLINNRGTKRNRTVFQNKFSSVDGLSDIIRDSTGEYSSRNGLNQRANEIREQFNLEQSHGIGTQGSNTQNNFEDNNFIQRNIPYIEENYSNINKPGYKNIPSEEVLYRHNTNLYVDVNKNSYVDSQDIVEPPIEFNIPLKQNLRIKTGLENIEILSPYSNKIDLFSNRNLTKQNNVLQNATYDYTPIDPAETFYEKSSKDNKSFQPARMERMDIIFPRTDKIGLAEVRTKARYEEELGIYRPDYLQSVPQVNPWSDNSYNNNSTYIRTFWKGEFGVSKRSRGIDQDGTFIGAYNIYGYPNRKEAINSNLWPGPKPGISSKYKYEGNPYNLMYSMDSNVEYIFTTGTFLTPKVELTCSNEQYGDLAPYSHFSLHKYITIGSNLNYQTHTQVKPSFIHTIFPNNFNALALNKSYQIGLDCRIKPFYNSYEEFRSNIKHKSQTFSVIPEFIVGNYDKLLQDDNTELIKTFIDTDTKRLPDYLTINGTERYEQIRDETYISDFKKFIDPKSNKIKFKLSAVKKLLPYNGFYPQQRTAQIAGVFSQEYMTNPGVITDSNKLSVSTTQAYNTNAKMLAITQPLFAPGILFNTIKAGLAVSWPVSTFLTGGLEEGQDVISSVKNSEHWNIVYCAGISENQNNIAVKKLTYKLPFESIYQPYKEYLTMYNTAIANISDIADFNNGSLYNNFSLTSNEIKAFLPYLDPTHYSNKANFSNTDLHMLAADLGKIVEIWESDKLLYQNYINNFLAEVPNFFLKNKNFISFKSDKQKYFNVQTGKTYSMDIVITKNNNFSMFNKYSVTQENYIPNDSLFGPPVAYGEPADGTNCTLSEPYQPYAPSYLNGRDVYTVSYTATQSGNISIEELWQKLELSWVKDETQEASKKRMSLKDSINIYLSRNLDERQYDPSTGKQTGNDEYYKNENRSWVIQTKFETPLLNFNKCSIVQTGSYEYNYESE